MVNPLDSVLLFSLFVGFIFFLGIIIWELISRTVRRLSHFSGEPIRTATYKRNPLELALKDTTKLAIYRYDPKVVSTSRAS